MKSPIQHFQTKTMILLFPLISVAFALDHGDCCWSSLPSLYGDPDCPDCPDGYVERIGDATNVCGWANMAIVITWGTIGQCNADPCATVICNSPPSQCHSSSGSCSAGTCSYSPLSSGHSCNDGNDYTINDQCDGNGGCSGYAICSCANGEVATGADCDVSGEKCKSCYDGWVGDACATPVCTCENGVPAVDPECDVPEEKCSSCNAGWTGDLCNVAICTCSNGEAATGVDCVVPEHKCISCNDGWDGDACDSCADGFGGDNCNAVCTCVNGVPAVYPECNVPAEMCSSCDEGWTGDLCNTATTCTLPITQTGYALLGATLGSCTAIADGCSDPTISGITCDTTNGYSGIPGVSQCSASNTVVTLTGCSAAACELPSTQTGYTIDSSKELSGCTAISDGCTTPMITGVTCDFSSGYSGTVDVIQCTASSTSAVLTGCVAICSCTNGEAATGDDCDVSGEKCISCNDGWDGDACDSCADGFDGDNCNPVCTCEHGVPAVYPECNVPGEMCSSCDEGWTGDLCNIDASTSFYSISNLGIYPTHTGDGYAGSATLSFVDSLVTITYTGLQGDSQCTGSASSAANSCGIHIHAGKSCEDDSIVGGHYYVGDSDPWADVIYTGADGSVTVDYGSTPADANGRVLIVHNYDGGRMTCSIISNEDVSTSYYAISNLGVYPINTGDGYAGSATLSFVDSVVSIAYTGLQGDSQCTGSASSAGNSCGIHIHAGKSCEDDSVVGGHYYVGGSDPWADVIYTGADGSVTVDYGSTPADADGRVLVVHNYDGVRMTCVIISNEDPCTNPSNPCLNGGSCTSSDGSAVCSCVDGWSGDTCEVDPDPCTYPSNPCLNGGACTSSEGSVVCSCADGWSGDTCEINSEMCDLMGVEGSIIIDVRRPDEWENGYLSCAHKITWDSEFTTDAITAITDGDMDANLILYCGSGKRAGAAIAELEAWGYTDLTNAGGYSDIEECSCPEEPATILTKEVSFDMKLSMTEEEVMAHKTKLEISVFEVIGPSALIVEIRIAKAESRLRRRLQETDVKVIVSTNDDSAVINAIETDDFVEDLQSEIETQTGLTVTVSGTLTPVVSDITDPTDTPQSCVVEDTGIEYSDGDFVDDTMINCHTDKSTFTSTISTCSNGEIVTETKVSTCDQGTPLCCQHSKTCVLNSDYCESEKEEEDDSGDNEWDPDGSITTTIVIVVLFFVSFVALFLIWYVHRKTIEKEHSWKKGEVSI